MSRANLPRKAYTLYYKQENIITLEKLQNEMLDFFTSQGWTDNDFYIQLQTDPKKQSVAFITVFNKDIYNRFLKLSDKKDIVREFDILQILSEMKGDKNRPTISHVSFWQANSASHASTLAPIEMNTISTVSKVSAPMAFTTTIENGRRIILQTVKPSSSHSFETSIVPTPIKPEYQIKHFMFFRGHSVWDHEISVKPEEKSIETQKIDVVGFPIYRK